MSYDKRTGMSAGYAELRCRIARARLVTAALVWRNLNLAPAGTDTTWFSASEDLRLAVDTYDKACTDRAAILAVQATP